MVQQLCPHSHVGSRVRELVDQQVGVLNVQAGEPNLPTRSPKARRREGKREKRRETRAAQGKRVARIDYPYPTPSVKAQTMAESLGLGLAVDAVVDLGVLLAGRAPGVRELWLAQARLGAGAGIRLLASDSESAAAAELLLWAPRSGFC